ncbi:MAG: thioredoxin family protein [Candidatus Kapabacteria bacterium]|nr:thioredoxin family protein [Candidatus Kapabacteria bacterium]
MFKKIIALLIISFTCYSFSLAEAEKHLQMQAKPSKMKVAAGEKFDVKLTIAIAKYWYTYALIEQLNSDSIGPTKTEISFAPVKTLSLTDSIVPPTPLKHLDEGFNIEIKYYKGKIEFDLKAKAERDLDFTKDSAYIAVFMQLCDTTSCLPPEEVRVLIGKNNPDIGMATGETEKIEQTKTDAENEIDQHIQKGVFSFIWFAMLQGALALLTPCVFPMIPITVSFFTKRAEKSKGKGLRDSLVYAIGIMSTFTAIGIVLAAIFGSSGIQNFATSPYVNFFIAAIFIVFALNLFGAFEIQIPSGIMNALNMKSNEGSGIGSVLLMGLTFSLTSFTCTVPFVGTALVSASKGLWFYPIIGMLAFSGVFAAPFFLLALFPTAMQKLPKAGGWMNNVKVVMGFLEIAAAIKFISNVDLVWGLGIMPRELFLAIWIACSTLITFYILGKFRFHHDSPVDSINSTRAVFSLFFASITFFLVTGLFGKPLGELDAFLPPPDYYQLMNPGNAGVNSVTKGNEGSKAIVSNNKEFSNQKWLDNLDEALVLAKRENKPVFVDFTGFTCTNCRWMEVNMFNKPTVVELFSKMILVRLYTDKPIEPYKSNQNYKRNRFNAVDNPLYVILTPDDKPLGTKNFTRDESAFVQFLKTGLEGVR